MKNGVADGEVAFAVLENNCASVNTSTLAEMQSTDLEAFM